jgi:hypothetical protein
MSVTRALDLLAMASALAAAWLWFLASRSRLRRVSRLEELDAADINRIVVVINRNQIMSSRAALAATVSALAAALHFAIDALTR